MRTRKERRAVESATQESDPRASPAISRPRARLSLLDQADLVPDHISGSIPLPLSPRPKTFGPKTLGRKRKGSSVKKCTFYFALLVLVSVPFSSTLLFSRQQEDLLYWKLQQQQQQQQRRVGSCPIAALDEHGIPGYIHDPTFLRRYPPEFQQHPFHDQLGICNRPFGSSDEGPAGLLGLKKVQIAEPKDVINATIGRGRLPPKVMCIVYTVSHRHERLRAIAQTFAPQCDGFWAATNLTDPSIGAVHLLHEGPESYKNMWSKVQAIWKYVHCHYLHEYDFFFLAGDDTYLIPPNLRRLLVPYMPDQLLSDEPAASSAGRTAESEPTTHENFATTPLLLGSLQPDPANPKFLMCGGGAGYILNRAAVQSLIEKVMHDERCATERVTSEEDRWMSKCFRLVQQVSCRDTRDADNEPRLHGCDAQFHATWRKRASSPLMPQILARTHHISQPALMGQISKASSSFHLSGLWQRQQNDSWVSDYADGGIRRYHAILYGMCSKGSKMRIPHTAIES